jgi:hypothetical protein
MSDLVKINVEKYMDQTDIAYVVDLLTEALRDEDWDTIMEAKEFLKEYLGDDGGPIELEE